MFDFIESYTHPSFIYDGKLFHRLRRDVEGVLKPSSLFIWFQTERVRRKGTTCGHGYVRTQLIQKETPHPENQWSSHKITPLLNYVSVTALNTKGMQQKECGGFGWAGGDEVAAVALQVQELVEDIDVPHLLETLQKNAQYSKRYATIIAEDVPEYLIVQDLNTTRNECKRGDD